MSTRTSMADSAWGSLAGELLLQALGDPRRHVAADVAAERGHVLDAAGAEERVLGAGHQVEGLDVGGLVAIELGHLGLVLVVADRPQALDDRGGADVLRELDDEDVEALGRDVLEPELLDRLLDERQPLLDVE